MLTGSFIYAIFRVVLLRTLTFYLQTWVIIGNIVSYEIQVFVEYQYTEHKGNKRDK